MSLTFVYAHAAVVIPEEKTEEVTEQIDIIRDVIVVKGMTYYGRITKLGAERLSFKLDDSEGFSRFLYEDIESITTNYSYRISYNRMDIIGRIVAIEDNKYLKVIEEKSHNVRTVNIDDIDNFVTSVEFDDSFENRMRNRIPFTKGDINFGFELKSGSSVKKKTDVLFNLRHKQGPHAVQLYVNYEYDRTRTGDNPEILNKDELVGILNYKNHYKNNRFYYAGYFSDYDRPRFIQRRYVPSIGYGIRLKLDKSKWIEPAIGIGYATTKYTDDLYESERFMTGALNIVGRYSFENVPFVNTVIIDGFIMYFPSIEGFQEDWVLRTNAVMTIPLFDFFSIKLTSDYTNDSNPDPSVGNNQTRTKILFGLDF